MRNPLILRLVGSAVVAALALGTAACSSSSRTSPSVMDNSMVSTTVSGCKIDVSSNLKVKPAVTISSCATPPATIQTDDIVTGNGPQVNQGQNVVVKYVGIAWSTRKQFDASWDRGQTFTVENLGAANVIMGWNIGLVGSRVGGRRLLVIPPDMGYGMQGNQGIKSNETLVFVVDIVSLASSPKGA